MSFFSFEDIIRSLNLENVADEDEDEDEKPCPCPSCNCSSRAAYGADDAVRSAERTILQMVTDRCPGRGEAVSLIQIAIDHARIMGAERVKQRIIEDASPDPF